MNFEKIKHTLIGTAIGVLAMVFCWALVAYIWNSSLNLIVGG